LAFIDDAASAIVGIEPAPGLKLIVGTTRDRLVRSYGDGSFLFRCRVAAPIEYRANSGPRCTIDAEHVIWLDLFHHTTEGARSSIRSDRHFRGSRWNVQGTKTLSNVEYVYFTDLDKIRTDADLKRIAMASDGVLHLLTTNGTVPQDVIPLKVYRQSTCDRQYTLRIRVPAQCIASQHVWRHDANDQAVYYEAAHQQIFRIGIEPRTVLPFDDDTVVVSRASLKHFEYVVLGYAVTKTGLVAPYNEEDTRELFKIERCDDPFAFWKSHPNRDLYTSKHVDLQKFDDGVQ
jgi:hypothetical protein